MVAAAGRPSSVDGTSSVMSAKPVRPSAEICPLVKGSLTDVTCCRAATFATAAATAVRCEVSRCPSGAANTATALPPAAAGKRSSNSCAPFALSLFGAVKSSRNAPPNEAVRAMTTAARTAHAPIVRHGRRALTSPRRRTYRLTLRGASGAAAGAVLGRVAVMSLPSGRGGGGCGEWGGWLDRSSRVRRERVVRCRVGGQHRDQWQSQVANLLQQAVQRGLVDDRAVQERGAAGLVGEAQPVEPGSPALVEVSGDPDVVLVGFVPVARGCVGLVHDRKVGAEVVSGDHHMW